MNRRICFFLSVMGTHGSHMTVHNIHWTQNDHTSLRIAGKTSEIPGKHGYGGLWRATDHGYGQSNTCTMYIYYGKNILWKEIHQNVHIWILGKVGSLVWPMGHSLIIEMGWDGLFAPFVL